MAYSRRRRRSIATRSTRTRTLPLRSKRRLDFQRWLFTITLVAMGALVVGFILSALTTRSGVEVNLSGADLADHTRLLTVTPDAADSEESGMETTDDRIQVEVLNGCGIPGIAGKFTDYLRAHGYDVVRFTNAQRYDYPRTLVFNRGTDFTSAQLVAQTLGVEANAVENIPDPSSQLDVQVILGQDYATLISYRELLSSRQ